MTLLTHLWHPFAILIPTISDSVTAASEAQSRARGPLGSVDEMDHVIFLEGAAEA